MRHRRGAFLRSLEEDIIVRRENVQTQDSDPEFTYPVGSAAIKAVILPNRGDADVGSYVVQDFQFLCNLTPPRSAIRIADEIVRNSGSADESVLTVKQTTTVREIQQLSLVMKNNVVA